MSLHLLQNVTISVASLEKAYVSEVEIALQADNGEAPWYLAYMNLLSGLTQLSHPVQRLFVAAQWEFQTINATLPNSDLSSGQSPPTTRSRIKTDLEMITDWSTDTSWSSMDDSANTSISYSEDSDSPNSWRNPTRRYPDFTAFSFKNLKVLLPLVNVEIKPPWISDKTAEMIKSDIDINNANIIEKASDQIVSQAQHTFSAYPISPDKPSIDIIYAITIAGTIARFYVFERGLSMPNCLYRSSLFNMIKYSGSGNNIEADFSHLIVYWDKMLEIFYEIENPTRLDIHAKFPPDSE